MHEDVANSMDTINLKWKGFPQYANFYFILITNLIMKSKFSFLRGKYQGTKLGSFQVITRLKIRSFWGIVINFEEKMSNNGSAILAINF